MRIKLNSGDRIRLTPDHGENLFVDISHEKHEAISVAMYEQCGYIEMRKKERQFKIFQFAKKSYKKECDFGWWKDAEVVYSFNRNGKDK